MVKYDENSIKTLNYRDAVREGIGMYIGANDGKGMHHLLTEIIANAMDEAAAGYGKEITVNINTTTNMASVIDNGRGIPFKRNKEGKWAIVEMCTNLHSGGKFTGQGNYKSSLGLNGVGATVTNALSTFFEIISTREGEQCIFTVKNGVFTDPTIKPIKTNISGSTVSFIPDASVFGALKWDIPTIKEELQLHALLNNGIRFNLTITDGNKVIENTSYYYTNGIKDMLKIKTADLKVLTDPFYFNTVVENDAGETCEVEYAFCYCDRTYETIYSFVNGGYTPNNGTHVTGWKTAFTSNINKLAKEMELIKDKNLSGDIIRKGLVLVLSIHMSERPLFGEQTKLTLNSPSARAFCSKAVGQMVLDKKVAKQVLDKIMIEQKAEEAAQRKREAQEKIARGGKNMNSLKDLPVKLADATDFSDAELFLTEGDSAAGGCKETKGAGQAVLPLRGKIKNCTSLELSDAIKSDIIKDILTCLGCGIGDHFNINNLRYNRIIILTDADADGRHIEILLLTLFLHHLPELIKQGKVYAAVSPLYRTINGKEVKYWYEDSSEFKKYMRNHKNAKLTRYKGLSTLLAHNLLFR